MDRHAKWIKTEQSIGTVSPEFRKEYLLRGPIRRATATVTAMGVYNLFVNGTKVGNAVMAPYWTSYPNRVQEQEYDVTGLMADRTVFGILLGKGWALGEVGYSRKKYVDGFFANHLSVAGCIRVEYEDGTEDLICTDGS